MADGHGGYRPPANPAPVSGPGAHSARTDGQAISTAPGQDYGAAKQQALAQQTQPMAAAPQMPPAPDVPDPSGQTQGQVAPQYSGGEFGAPSQRPNEPVTHGVDIGPGGGSAFLNLGNGAPQSTFAQTDGSMTRLLSQLSASDTTGVLADLLQNAAAGGY
jgi:hypothetical protein